MKKKKQIKVTTTSINFATATEAEIDKYLYDMAKNYKPSGKNDLVSYIRRERGHRR